MLFWNRTAIFSKTGELDAIPQWRYNLIAKFLQKYTCGNKILEAGGGTCRFGKKLSDNGMIVVSIDIAKKMLRHGLKVASFITCDEWYTPRLR